MKKVKLGVLIFFILFIWVFQGLGFAKETFNCLSDNFEDPIGKVYDSVNGQCVVYVRHETEIEYKGCNGEAWTCYEKAEANGFAVGQEPIVGAIIVFNKDSSKKGLEVGHVGIVKAVNGDILTIRDSNWVALTVSEHDINITQYDILGYIYCGGSPSSTFYDFSPYAPYITWSASNNTLDMPNNPPEEDAIDSWKVSANGSDPRVISPVYSEGIMLENLKISFRAKVRSAIDPSKIKVYVKASNDVWYGDLFLVSTVGQYTENEFNEYEVIFGGFEKGLTLKQIRIDLTPNAVNEIWLIDWVKVHTAGWDFKTNSLEWMIKKDGETETFYKNEWWRIKATGKQTQIVSSDDLDLDEAVDQVGIRYSVNSTSQEVLRVYFDVGFGFSASKCIDGETEETAGTCYSFKTISHDGNATTAVLDIPEKTRGKIKRIMFDLLDNDNYEGKLIAINKIAFGKTEVEESSEEATDDTGYFTLRPVDLFLAASYSSELTTIEEGTEDETTQETTDTSTTTTTPTTNGNLSIWQSQITDTSISVGWSKDDWMTYSYLRVYLDGGMPIDLDIGAEGYNFTGLVSGRSYSVTVEYSDSATPESGDMVEASYATTENGQVVTLPAPKVTVTEVGYNDIHLDWPEVEGAIKYKVLVQSPEYGGKIPESEWSVYGRTPGTKYDFAISACTSSICGSTNTFSVTTKPYESPQAQIESQTPLVGPIPFAVNIKTTSKSGWITGSYWLRYFGNSEIPSFDEDYSEIIDQVGTHKVCKEVYNDRETKEYCVTVTTYDPNDLDGDGVPNALDICPEDKLKTVTSICPCGTPDTDSDSDGTPDCLDQCPLDPNKVEPGVCPCGVPDIDTDGDGVLDCHDSCPENNLKTAEDDCPCDREKYRYRDFEAIPDQNHNGAVDFALIKVDPITRQPTVYIVDRMTSQVLKSIPYYEANAYPIEIDIVDDVNGNGSKELFLSLYDCGRKATKFRMIDIKTGARIYDEDRITFPKPEQISNVSIDSQGATICVTLADKAQGFILFKNGAELAKVASDCYTDTEVTAGEYYSYAIKYFSGGVESKISDELAVAIPLTTEQNCKPSYYIHFDSYKDNGRTKFAVLGFCDEDESSRIYIYDRLDNKLEAEIKYFPGSVTPFECFHYEHNGRNAVCVNGQDSEGIFKDESRYVPSGELIPRN